VSIEPVITSRSQHPISRKWISPNAVRVLYRLKEEGYHAYLVGGGVRDLLLGREPKDFDIATDAKPNEIKKIFRNCRLIGRRFRLAHIHFHDEIIEVATFRSNIAEEPAAEAVVPPDAADTAAAPEPAPLPEPMPPSPEGEGTPIAQPSEVRLEKPRPPRMLKTEDGMILRDNVFGTPEQDALRRDFTVNALFYNIANFSVIDYVGGMDDLKKGLIRIIGDPMVRFTEDPVRMVRAVRFSAMLGLTIEEQTEQALLDLRDRVGLANASRMWEEVQKLFLLGEGEKTFQLLRKYGMFGIIFPALNEWIDTESGGFPHIWVGKAFEWVDTCVQSGKKVEPHILFALLAGQYIEEKAEGLRKNGLAPLEALDKAVTEFLAEHTPRVQIPRKLGLMIRDMLWNQGRFEKTQGKQPLYFYRRPGFRDAFEYLRFSSEVTGQRLELRAWWKEFIKVHANLPEAKPEPGKPHTPSERSGKRRRRRPRKPGAKVLKPTP